MFWKKKYEKAVAERDAMRQQLEQSRREITEQMMRVDYYDALFKCASDMCEKWHALCDERFEKMKLRAELEEWKEHAELWANDANRGDARIRELEAENERLRAEIAANERKED